MFNGAPRRKRRRVKREGGEIPPRSRRREGHDHLLHVSHCAERHGKAERVSPKPEDLPLSVSFALAFWGVGAASARSRRTSRSDERPPAIGESGVFHSGAVLRDSG